MRVDRTLLIVLVAELVGLLGLGYIIFFGNPSNAFYEVFGALAAAGLTTYGLYKMHSLT